MAILLIAAGFYLLLVLLVVSLSSWFSAALGAGDPQMRAPRNRLRLPPTHHGLIARWTFVVWRCIDACFADDPTVRTRIELYAFEREDEPDAAAPAPPATAAQIRARWVRLYKEAYHLLGILNEKAEALMVYSGLTLAVIGVASISDADTELNSHYWLTRQITKHGFADTIALTTLLSIICCLVVVAIFWLFLEFAIPAEGEAGPRSYETEWKLLIKVLIVRQRCFQAAWLFAILAWAMLFLFVCTFGV